MVAVGSGYGFMNNISDTKSEDLTEITPSDNWEGQPMSASLEGRVLVYLHASRNVKMLPSRNMRSQRL